LILWITGGWNNNPSCKQFSATFKRLLVHSGVKPGKKANVMEDSTLCLKTTQVQRRGNSDAPSPFEVNEAAVAVDHSYYDWFNLSI